MITDIELSVDWLKKNHQMIHYFGLGFIQLKIDKYRRLHFYTSELPPIVDDEDVHNHRYNFTSFVLKGDFCQHVFDVVPGMTHVMEEETCRKGEEAKCWVVSCSLELNSQHNYSQGSLYMVSHKTFHRVYAKNCITSIVRSDYKKENAQVVRPVGAPKICPFSQQVEESRLWEIVASMLSP